MKVSLQWTQFSIWILVLSILTGCQGITGKQPSSETSIDMKLSQQQPPDAPSATVPKPQENFEQESPGALSPN